LSNRPAIIAITAKATRPTPTPIPILAPKLRPVSGAAVLLEVLVLGVDVCEERGDAVADKDVDVEVAKR